MSSVLGMTREATVKQITKAYRKLARQWHPDRHRTDGKMEEAQTKFQLIATAYEASGCCGGRRNGCTRGGGILYNIGSPMGVKGAFIGRVFEYETSGSPSPLHRKLPTPKYAPKRRHERRRFVPSASVCSAAI